MKSFKAFDDLVVALVNKCDQNGDGKLSREDLREIVEESAHRFSDDLFENVVIAALSFAAGMLVLRIWQLVG